MQPIVVEVRRGDVVESRHRVHAVAVREGAIVAAAGDPERLAYLRSSAKPIQALPLVRARPDVTDEEIAVACASHGGRPAQLAAVRSLLARAPAGENDLECGPDPTRVAHNCSGKHAGFLALCRGRGWDTPGYRHPSHPCQQEMLAEVAAIAGLAADTIPTAVDGCGVVTFALPLRLAAQSFARLREQEGGDRVVRAMRSHPGLLEGVVATDVLLARSLDGWIAKGGAEGLLCASSPEGLGLALKVEDGSFRALQPALGAFLAELGLDVALGDVPLDNSRGEPVGIVCVAPRGDGHGPADC